MGCSASTSELNKEKKKMKEYLEGRYKKEFIVKTPKQRESGLFVPLNQFYSQVYLKEEPNIKFDISVRYYYGKNNERKVDYQDDFLNKIWSFDGKGELEKQLSTLYKDSVKNIFYSLRTNDQSINNSNYQEVRKEYGSRLKCWLWYDVYIENELYKKPESEKIYKVFKSSIIDYNIEVVKFKVCFINNNYNINEVTISNKDIVNIKNASSIEKFFKY